MPFHVELPGERHIQTTLSSLRMYQVSPESEVPAFSGTVHILFIKRVTKPSIISPTSSFSLSDGRMFFSEAEQVKWLPTD